MDETALPSVYDVRACLSIDVGGLVMSPEKVDVLRRLFSQYEECFAEPSVFNDHFIQVQNFLLTVVAELLRVDGMREEMTFHLSVCCPALLLAGDVSLLSEEVSHFTQLLLDLRRVTALVPGSFPSFLERIRNMASSVYINDACSAVEIFRVCNSVPMRQLFRYLMCLSESPLMPLSTGCVEVGQLSSDVTTSVCSSILSFLKSHSVRNYESVSGPLLEEV